MTNVTLIPVFTGTLQDQPVQLCNARDLHAFLKSRQEFATWIKNRVETYGFIEGEDYLISLSKTSKGAKGGRPTTDYHLTLDTAKELAMVENNDQGRQARRYFIALEKRLGQAQPAAEPPPLALDNHRHITPAQAEEISTLICALFPGHLERHGAWRRFKANFKIHSYRRLPAHKFDEAITFIESTDARRRNEFGREGGQSSSHLALRDIGPQIDLAALSRQVAEYLIHENRDDSPTIGQTDLTKIEALLNETMEQFNSLPNGLIYQNLHAVMSLLKKGKSKANRLQGVRRLELPQPKSSLQSDLVQFMRELDLPCVEIGLYEIEDTAGCNLAQLPLGDLAEVTAKTLSRRPEHIADIQLVSGWIFAEVNSTDAKRDGVRQQWLDVARRIEDALSS